MSCRRCRKARELPTWLVAMLVFVVAGAHHVFAQTGQESGRQRTRDNLRTPEAAAEAPPHVDRDSTLRSYSINDLLEYRDFYERERIRIEGERGALREKGISDMETFLASHPESKILDRVLVRLAELYYERALENYANAQEQYSKQLEQFDAGQLAEKPVEPRKDFSPAVVFYQRIIDEYPQSPLQDDANYNLAFLTEDAGNREEAVKLYERFIAEFPDSKYLADAIFRIGEYYFNPPVNDLDRAIEFYKRVLNFSDSPKYVEALYRLGWSYYKKSAYPEAISYFTLLADDVTRAQTLDPENKITNPNLAEESIEYIGISFLDFVGAEGAAHYLSALGGREYGLEILRRIGDIYMTVKEEYDSAVRAFLLLLRMYPNASDAPVARAKIAECYRFLEDEQMAYLHRDTLFMNYREGLAWWNHNPKEEVRAEGRLLAERALRENINLLLRLADKSGDAGLYAQAVLDSRKYLDAFPKDSTAALIHWNLALTLDARLNYAHEAYDEYLKISNLYWSSRFQKMAAENAVALAQEMVKADSVALASRPKVMPLSLGQIKAAVQADSAQTRQALHLERIPLSPGEDKLGAAIDNYIKLFPHDPATAARLTQAGALHYNKNDFTQAVKYFKTLLKHFPASPEAPYAQYLVMESYFGKLDYKSCEVVARRIKLSETNPEFVAKASQRLAESIFLQAEGLASVEQHVRAAEEYRRVFEEVPTAEFADLALYNAGLEFDKAREYRRAVETYDLMSDNFPQSQHYLAALNNMAYDYGELADYLNAALTFERIATEEPDSARAEVNLYNASVFFVRAEDWQRAIRVNRKFVETYPRSKDADDLFYDMANYHLKLDDLESANRVYGEYSEKFPDSPRVVETFYRCGEYHERNNDLTRARVEYEKAIARSDDFRRRDMDFNHFFSAEAHFRLTELKYRDFAKVNFRLPKAAMDESKERKKNALLEIVEGYTRVAGYGTLRLYEATHKIGAAYEEFARAWADQEIPEVDDNRRIVARKEVNETAAQLYERALEAYKHSAVALDRLARKYAGQAPEDTAMQRDEKVAPRDTTLQVASHWIGKSKEKVSEVIFDIAELNDASMKQLLEASAPENMDKVAALEFRNQLLNKFVKPLAGQILNAHQRNIEECDSLGIESEWIGQSRRKIIETNNVLAREYALLAQRALIQYAHDFEAYKTAVTGDAVRMIDLQEEMANLIEFSHAFAKAAAQTYVETLARAQRVRTQAAELEDTKSRLLEFVFRICAGADSLALLADHERRAFEEKIRQEGKSEFQEAALAFEDGFYSLTEGRKEILQAGFEAIRAYDIQNPWSENIIMALVRSEPMKYAAELDLTIADTSLASDGSWLATAQYYASWASPDSQAGNWQPARVIAEAQQFSGYGAKRLWGPSTKPLAAGDSAAVEAGSDSIPVRITDESAEEGYFRKTFEIRGLPVAGQIQIAADDSYNLFVNGEFIAKVPHTGRDSIATRVHDVVNFLKTGANVIALHVQDTDRSGGALEALLFLKTLPGWEQRQHELQIRKEKQDESLILERGTNPQ